MSLTLEESSLFISFAKKLRLKWHLQKKVPFHQRSSLYHPLLCFESHTRDFWHGILDQEMSTPPLAQPSSPTNHAVGRNHTVLW